MKLEWEKAYDSLRMLLPNGKRINSEEIINRVKRLNEWHREMFMDYYNHFLIENKISSFKTHRHPILQFLLQESINKKRFGQITQQDIDDFLMNKMDSNKKIQMTTVDNNQSAIKSYFTHYANELSFVPIYMDIKNEEKNLMNKVSPLKCGEIEDIRNIIKDEPYLQFIVEFAYENRIRFENSREYNKKNYNEKTGTFTSTTGKDIILSEKLKQIVERIKNTEEFTNPRYKQGFSKKVLYEKLKEKGFNRPIKSSDINETFDRSTSFKCPGCGNVYEAIAENWIIKQYHENGQLWIVCKEKCGVQHANL